MNIFTIITLVLCFITPLVTSGPILCATCTTWAIAYCSTSLICGPWAAVCWAVCNATAIATCLTTCVAPTP